VEQRGVLKVKIKKALTIPELYERCRGYDYVLTPDTPLADALNGRIDSPRLGRLAYTPRGLVHQAGDDEQSVDRRQLFLKIVQETDLSWKEALYYLENILHCWQETGNLKKILNYSRFDRGKCAAVMEILNSTSNVFKSQAEFEWKSNPRVAVIGMHQFRGLGRSVLPPNFTRIDPFKRGEYFDLPDFSVFNSASAIVETVVENIDRENAYDIAIVMEPGSHYQPLLEAAFCSREIPYIHRTHLAEVELFRIWLQMMRMGLVNTRLRLRDLQPVLRQLGHYISDVKNRRYFNYLNEEELREIKDFISNVHEYRFTGAIERFEDFSGVDMPELRHVVFEMGISNSRLAEEKINLLSFYLDSFHVNVDADENKGGVLLASPLAGAYVDRPSVFYLGMDASWTRQIAEKPWVDIEQTRADNLLDFQLFLQNGRRQYYMVQNRQMNRTVTPCFYFNVLGDEEVSTFEDLPHRRYRWENEKEAKGFPLPADQPPVQPVETISQSSLKCLVRCPREYYFSKLVPTPENRHLIRGGLYHDFAEFYLEHADFVRNRGRSDFVKIIVDELGSFVDELEKYRLEVETRVALSNIMAYLDAQEIDITPPVSAGRETENFFAEKFDLPLVSNVSEVWFEDPSLGVKGKIDLLQGPDHLLDYKSGRLKSINKIIRNSNVNLAEKEVDFQVILYLAYQRRINSKSKLKFTFFHFLENLTDVIAGEATPEDNLVTVTYYPRLFAEQIIREETYQWLIEGISTSNNRFKTLDGLGYKSYRDFFAPRDLPDFYDKDEIVESDLAGEFIDFTRNNFKDVGYVEKGCLSALKKLVDFRTTNFFSEDLDGFEKFLDDRLGELNLYLSGRFPVQGWLKDFDLDDLDRRDLVRVDNIGT
jgi:hypothetical protein